MTYTPKPIDTSSQQLPSELVPLRELLAENTHEVWAETRIGQGWTYGPARNDVKKQHPDLVPYADLDDSEKVYDRNVSTETILALLTLGYAVGGIKPQRE